LLFKELRCNKLNYPLKISFQISCTMWVT
jgi:hypothetical protein